MQAEIITIGTELLLGQSVDTNSAWLGRKMAELGINLYRKQSIGDNKKRLTTYIKRALEEADLIITTGGLGPTQDDVTRAAIADVFDLELVKNETSVSEIEKYFSQAGRQITENNYKQAYLPEGAVKLANSHGTAPGFILNNSAKTIVVLPGVPNEMKAMMTEQVLPYLKEKSLVKAKVIESKIIKTCGIGESDLETKIADILKEQTNPTIALLANLSGVKIRITAKADNREEARELIKKEEEKIATRLSEYIFSYENQELEEVVAELLWANDLKLATAESCTGGLIANRLTDVSGSSKYFERGVVSYSNQSKQELLGVKEATLKDKGAVSKEVAVEMAKGVKKLADTEIALATTGIAGPTGGSKEKSVGLVYLAIVINDKVITKRYNFNGRRKKIKYLTSQFALNTLRKAID